MDQAIDKNMIDRDEYPATAELQRRCVHMLAGLWHARCCGDDGLLDGGIERGSNARRHRDEASMAGTTAGGRQADASAEADYWSGADLLAQFARNFDVELREILMAGGRLELTPDSVAAMVDDKTIGVVATLGVTFTGRYEPVAANAAALDTISGAGHRCLDPHRGVHSKTDAM